MGTEPTPMFLNKFIHLLMMMQTQCLMNQVISHNFTCVLIYKSSTAITLVQQYNYGYDKHYTNYNMQLAL